MKNRSFLWGAAILAVGGLISKFLGGLYRIPFFRVVGSESMGLYQMAYPLYTMLLALSSAGIPVAVSKLISENLARGDMGQVRKVFAVALVYIGLLSGIASLALYKSAHFLAVNVLHDTRAYYSIVAVSPAIFFVGIMSVFRGYFQGFHEMAPTACSQVIEQFMRVFTVLVGAYLFLPRGVEFAAAAATFGAVTGAIAGTVFLMVLYFIRPFFNVVPIRGGGCSRTGCFNLGLILRRISILAFPISLGGLVLPVMQTLDAVTVPARLQLAGYSVSRATQLYGELTGGAATLINLPAVITISIAASIVPAISASYEKQNFFELNRQAETAVRITILVCLPAAVGLAVLAAPISELLFNCPEAGKPLAFLALAAVFLGMHQTTAGILQGMGRTMIPVINLMAGAGLKFLANYFLTAAPQLGVLGAAVGTVAGFAVSSAMNCLFIRRLTGWSVNYRKILLKPLTTATIMGIAVYLLHSQLTIIISSSLATVIAVGAGFLIYVSALAATGAFRTFGIPGPTKVVCRLLRLE